MKKSRIAKVLAVSLSFTTVLSMFPGFAFANGDSNTKTIYGNKAVVEDDGTYRDYYTHIKVKIDANGKIVSVEDIDTASNIDRFAPESKPYWQKFVNGKGFDLFKGKTKETLKDVDVNAISQATTSTKSVRDTILSAFDTDEQKQELLADVDSYGPASKYIEKDRAEAEKLIKEVKEKINSEELISNARRHYLNFESKIKKLKTSSQVEEDNKSKTAGEKTKDAIESLGDITAEKKEAVETARQMYNALDANGKKAVTTAVYKKLLKAEDEIFNLVYKNNCKKVSGSSPIENYGYNVSLTVYLSGDKIIRIEDNGTLKSIEADDNLSARNKPYWLDTFLPNGGLYNYIGKTTSNYKNVDAISNATYTSDAAKRAIGDALKKADENNLIEQIKADIKKLEEKLDRSSESALNKLENDYSSLSSESKKKLDDAGYGARIKALRVKFAALSTQPEEEDKIDPSAKQFTRSAKLVYPDGHDSMVFTKAFNPEVKIAEKDGKATYTVSFKESGMMGVTEKLEKLTVDGKDYKAKVGKDPYVSVFTFTRNTLDEGKIPVTVYSKMMNSSYEMNIVFTGEKTSVEKPGTENPKPGTETPKPGTENPKPGTETPKPGTENPGNQNAKKFYIAQGKFLKPNGSDMKLMTEAFNPVVKIAEENGKATYTISFKKAGMMGIVEALGKISVDGKEIKASKGEGEYVSQFTFTRNSLNETEIPIKIYVKAMNAWLDGKVVISGKKVDPNPSTPEQGSNPSNPEQGNKPNEQVKPSIKSGLNQTWIRGSQFGLVIVSDADISTFKKVLLDGKELVKGKDYQVVSGSTKVTLSPEMLNKLSSGVHNVEIVSTNGSAFAKFTIADKFDFGAKAPNTGDANTTMPIALAGLVGSAFIALTLKKIEFSATAMYNRRQDCCN